MDIDRFIDAMDRIAQLGAIRRAKAEADQTDRPRCGSCQHWMKSRECPRERNVNGYSRGPSCDALPCSKFDLKPSVAALKVERLAAAEAALAAFEASAP